MLRTFSIKESIVFLLAIASLIPISLSTEQATGVYINYFYAFLLFIPFIKYRFSKVGMYLVVIYTVVFLVGLVKMLTNDLYYAQRVTFSYIVFIIPFVITFIKIEDNYFEKFKQAVIWGSIFYSVFQIYQLLIIGYDGDFYKTKELIGSNRFGFIVIFAFFVLLFEKNFRFSYKVFFLALMIVGLTLTFSRSSIVAFAVAVFVMAVMNFRRINVKCIAGALIFCLIVALIFRETIIGQLIDFFSNWLLSYDKYNLTSQQSSEGYRFYVLGQILKYLSTNPLFGSNYAGLYLLYDEYRELGASSHNQYTDVLLRTGLVGFITYIFILFKIMKYYFRTHPGVFFGLVGILIYGMFHETFKMAHGSLIFAFLLSYYLYKKEPSYKLILPKASSPEITSSGSNKV
jgi:O-antigen ligase